ncbi:hypothetical protein RQP53_04720 [Paucibacter sp. APW11]|uniref:MalT-like TPR region domain-containing protein n=1 Tax=Roseateles aquae TaxID=3077235 RepID=A0ABU3P7M3_9BURK|nr:hypothetical protein [Paucibacter sp. APW11]MDT8998571.1 hypothetical protein [Paucibacter sp. APW11]
MQYPSAVVAALEAALAELSAQFALGQFTEVLAQLPPLFEGVDGLEDSPCKRDLQLRLLFIRARCHSKFDRFGDTLQDCAEMLNLRALDEGSRQRAELMELISYCHVNLSMPEQALRAAQVTLQDGLLLRDPLLCSQGLERSAMAYLCMGDALEAERFMIESLGFVEQQGLGYERLRRYSNAIHLLCALHDNYLSAGNQRMAQGVLERGQRLLPLGDALASGEPSEFIRLMWHANMGRWKRRQGRLSAAQEQLASVLASPSTRQWHGLRRSMQLELALIAEASDRLDDALALLQALFEPQSLRVRDVEALGAMAAQLRVLILLQRPAEAERVSQALAQRRNERMQAARQAHQQLQGVRQRIISALAQADRQRVEHEIHRLRGLRHQSAALQPSPEAQAWISEQDMAG